MPSQESTETVQRSSATVKKRSGLDLWKGLPKK